MPYEEWTLHDLKNERDAALLRINRHYKDREVLAKIEELIQLKERKEAPTTESPQR